MTRFFFPMMTLGLIGGCMAPQTATGSDPTYNCTATRVCKATGCEPSDREFNLSHQALPSMVISFVDSVFTLDYVESTSAFLPDGPVSLTTYQDPDTVDGMTLTLADDGSQTLRARLILRPESDRTDTSAVCVPYEDARP